MKNIRVLMIGPGEPSSANTGLGIATANIQNELAKLVDLVVIEPSELEKNSKSKSVTNISSFTESVVIQDIVKISIQSKINPYVYDYSSTESIKSEELSESIIQKELKSYSQTVVKNALSIDFDIIYAHDWLSFRAGIKLKEQTGKPLVLHIHSLDIDRVSANTSSWVYELEKEAIKKADAIIAVSLYSAEIIISAYSGDKDRIHVVYPGRHEFSNAKKSTSVTDPTVLFLGRISAQKGAVNFLSIAEEVVAKKPEVHFLMVGDGDLKPDLVEMIAQKGLSSNFHFNDFVDHAQLGDIFNRASLLCVPSISEPFGLVAIEAAEFGLPVVITKQSGAKEVLDGVTALDNDDIQGFANEILKILDKPKYAKEMVLINSQSISKLKWKNSAQEIGELLSGLVVKA